MVSTPDIKPLFNQHTVYDLKEFVIDFNGTLSGFFTAHAVINEMVMEVERHLLNQSHLIALSKIKSLLTIVNNAASSAEKYKAMRDAATILQWIAGHKGITIQIIDRVDEDPDNTVQPIVQDKLIQSLIAEGFVINVVDNDANIPGTKLIAAKDGKDLKIQRINTWRVVCDKVDDSDETVEAAKVALKTAGVP